MDISSIPLIYHPTCVTFIDDEKNFLLGLELDFNVCEGESNHYFTDPQEGLRFVNNAIANTECPITRANNLENGAKFIVNNLHHSIYDKTRFNILSTVVVDYRMPNMDGLSLCQNIKSNIIQKILLTGEDDSQLAINSLNNRIVDQFISKKPIELTDKLNVGIEKAKARYFRQLSFQLMFGVSPDLEKLLLMPSFQQLFRQTKEDSNAVEFYLMDNSGSFLFLDKDANPTWLIVRNRYDYSYQLEVLSTFVESSALTNNLKEKNKLLFLSKDTDYEKDICCWDEYLLEATRLEEDYFYAISHRKFDQIQWNKICSLANSS